jgi:hypothetical protein
MPAPVKSPRAWISGKQLANQYKRTYPFFKEQTAETGERIGPAEYDASHLFRAETGERIQP